jgi:hypothetical protein
MAVPLSRELTMTTDPKDVIRVAAGERARVEVYRQALTDAGVDCRVVGDELAAGLGTALPGSIELWVHRADAQRAAAAVARVEADRGRHPPDQPPHGHPTSDPRPAQPDVPRPHTHYDPDPRS